MKTILITTDFSEGATHAVKYGYNLAQEMNANIVLCNAVLVQAEMPQAGLVVKPMDSYQSLLNASSNKLSKLKAILENTTPSGDFHPVISYVSERGILSDVVKNITDNRVIDLVIMGSHRSLGFNYFMLGNHTLSMIDKATLPILFIPAEAKIKKLNKIAYAADFKHPKEGLASFNIVLSLARVLNAEIMLTHIYNEKHNSPDFHDWAKQSLVQLQRSSDYNAISYKFLPNGEIESGLSLLCEKENFDLLAMVHRPHNFIDSLINESKTQKLAKHISIPLLVLPVNY